MHCGINLAAQGPVNFSYEERPGAELVAMLLVDDDHIPELRW
jgi:hypothetical protein